MRTASCTATSSPTTSGSPPTAAPRWATSASRTRRADRLTAEGVVVGTVRYLSPEQIRGEEAGAGSDLYALGVTLYELVAGRPPFTAAAPAHCSPST